MPDQTPTQEISIESAIANLPSYLKKAIAEIDPLTKSVSMAQKYKLYIDQQEGLGREVLSVMLGFTELSEFLKNLTSEVGIPSDAAEEIADDIATEIFIPLRDKMREYSESERDPEITPKAPQAPTAPTQTPTQSEGPNSVDKTLSQTQTSSLDKKTLGLAPKPEKKYTVDPYREPFE